MGKIRSLIQVFGCLSVLICANLWLTSAQNGTPAPVRLNPEASKQYIEIEQREQEIVRQANEQLMRLSREKFMLLIGAGGQKEGSYNCTADKSQIVTCAPTPKATPSPPKN